MALFWGYLTRYRDAIDQLIFDENSDILTDSFPYFTESKGRLYFRYAFNMEISYNCHQMSLVVRKPVFGVSDQV